MPAAPFAMMGGDGLFCSARTLFVGNTVTLGRRPWVSSTAPGAKALAQRGLTIVARSPSWYGAKMNVQAHFDDLFRQLEDLLKQPEAATSLTQLGINTSIALLAAQGLHSYLRGEKGRGAEDLATAAEEIRARLETNRTRDE